LKLSNIPLLIDYFFTPPLFTVNILQKVGKITDSYHRPSFTDLERFLGSDGRAQIFIPWRAHQDSWSYARLRGDMMCLIWLNDPHVFWGIDCRIKATTQLGVNLKRSEGHDIG